MRRLLIDERMKNILSEAALRKTGERWEFSSEAALEDFIWNNIAHLIDLTPLHRQYSVQGEFCDILALDRKKRLVILELKNYEDRHVVQQLTRYYEGFLIEKPFNQLVNYANGIRLIAISPSFHRHSFIDKKYNKLKVEFWEFKILLELEKFYFEIKNIDNQKAIKLKILYQKVNFNSKFKNLPEPPRLFLDWLGTCTPCKQEGFIMIREKILSYHHRMKEITDYKSIKYGAGRTKICAEFCLERKSHQPILFLWLPLPSLTRKPRVGRVRVWTDGNIVSHIGHVPKGLGKMKLKSEWDEIPIEKWPRKTFTESLTRNSFTPVRADLYIKRWSEKNDTKADDFKNPCNTLEFLVNLSLEKWLSKL